MFAVKNEVRVFPVVFTFPVITAPAPTTAQVLSATAGASWQAVGSYGLFRGTSVPNPGGTAGGGSFEIYNADGGIIGGPSGTWRVMGSSGDGQRTTLALRIS